MDNDGDLDLVLNNENQESFVYRNNSREQGGNNYVGVILKGRKGNEFGIGTKIKVYGGGQVFYREQVPSRGFQSSVDYKQVIGVGQLKKIDSVELIWADRSYTRYYDVKLNEVREYKQPSTPGLPAYVHEVKMPPLLVADSTDMEAHQEDDYIDFYYERNLPELLSREGPAMSVGDVNGDGLEDVFMGGGKGQGGRLYEQTAEGKLVKKEEQGFKGYADFEDVVSLFFDADGDGDLDLYVGAGGNNMPAGSRESQHRLYKNDGKGNFSIDISAFPNNDMNTGVVANYDYDGDGDEDLYVGSRSVPYHYGSSPQSYVYNNDGKGRFRDVTEELNRGLARKGMITGAGWSDVTGDGRKELVIVGEWMSPVIYAYNKTGNRLEELKHTGLEELYGWWQTVKAGDLNGDGREDLVLGNIGENFYLRPDKDHPVKLWLNDFDRTGTVDHFLTRSVGGRDVPVFLKREITDQFPMLKKENLLHREYAKKDVEGLFGRELVKGSEQKLFTYCKSVVAYNEGGGRFRVEALPLWVQLSSVNAVELKDLNGDRQLDLVLGGNKFVFPPQFGRLDGSYGHVLLNAGGGKLKYIENRETGLRVRGEVKGIGVIRMKDRTCLLFAVNSEKPAFYT
ncbi:MAG: VCBS repeat-containing protein, partial [Bacteroidetes bacterium]|nr:VCBS repeat-containing protein [Bacteroidota bacterium]